MTGPSDPHRSAPRLRSRVLGDLARVALASLAGLLLVAAYTTYRIWEQGSRDDARRAGAIVVLGAAQFDGRPSDVFSARLDHAVELYLAGMAPYLIVTGGSQAGDRTTEAATAAAYAVRHGVPATAILSEDQGRTTLESLDGVAAILRDHGIVDAIFVSDRTHMLRVLRIARDRGIDALGSPTPSSPSDLDLGRRIDATLHEIGALGFYFLGRGRLDQGVTPPQGAGRGVAHPRASHFPSWLA